MDETMQTRRELAIKRLREKAGFRIHLLAYLAVNLMLVLFWALNDAGRQADLWRSFWPIYPIAGWGVAVAIHAYTLFWGGAPTEEEIQREMGKPA
jgi:2TM domain-containing protein